MADLSIGRTLADTTASANVAIKELTDWGAKNGISFEPAKTEAIHFTRRPRDKDVNLPVLHGTEEITPGLTMRWLGVWFDRKLTFRPHVEAWAAKGMRAAGFLRSLTNLGFAGRRHWNFTKMDRKGFGSGLSG